MTRAMNHQLDAQAACDQPSVCERFTQHASRRGKPAGPKPFDLPVERKEYSALRTHDCLT